MRIGNDEIGEGHGCYLVAEMSANHCQRFDTAVDIVKRAKECGANAVKVQLYTPDTMTIPIHTGDFFLTEGLWSGFSLHDLYSHTCMPWEWYPELMAAADMVGITIFPTVYDRTSLEFVQKYDPPAYKVASFEIGDRMLLDALAEMGKPTLISTGCAAPGDFSYIDGVFSRHGTPYELLLCTSAYPAKADMGVLEQLWSRDFHAVSDHTQGIGFPIVCAAHSAYLIEKHFWLGAGDCADREFSLDPGQFSAMVEAIRGVEAAMGELEQGGEPGSDATPYQRSLYAVRPIAVGETLTEENVRMIRPGFGGDPRLYREVLGKTATVRLLDGFRLTPDTYE